MAKQWFHSHFHSMVTPLKKKKPLYLFFMILYQPFEVQKPSNIYYVLWYKTMCYLNVTAVVNYVSRSILEGGLLKIWHLAEWQIRHYFELETLLWWQLPRSVCHPIHEGCESLKPSGGDWCVAATVVLGCCHSPGHAHGQNTSRRFTGGFVSTSASVLQACSSSLMSSGN